MMVLMQIYHNASKTLYDELKTDTRLNSNSIIVFEPHTGGHCFRLKFANLIGEVHGISVSYPMDVYPNKIGQPEVIEIVLIDDKGDLCYVENLGYYDVCRFNSSNEIVEEILRLLSTNC